MVLAPEFVKNSPSTKVQNVEQCSVSRFAAGPRTQRPALRLNRRPVITAMTTLISFGTTAFHHSADPVCPRATALSGLRELLCVQHMLPQRFSSSFVDGNAVIRAASMPPPAKRRSAQAFAGTQTWMAPSFGRPGKTPTRSTSSPSPTASSRLARGLCCNLQGSRTTPERDTAAESKRRWRRSPHCAHT